MHGLVQARRRGWRQATQADGLAQQVALPFQAESPQRSKIKSLRAARHGKINIGQISQESAGFSGEVGALFKTR